MGLENVYAFFETYDKATYVAVACQGSEPTEGDLAAFEGDVGFRLPEEFRKFTLSPLGGLYFEVKEEIWPRAKAYDVGPFWTFLYGIKVFGISQEIPDWLDIRIQKQSFEEGLVPFLQRVCDSDCYCFNSKGEIVKWLHETPDELEVVELSFSELLLRELAELEVRKHCKINKITPLEYRRGLSGGVYASTRVDVYLGRRPSSPSTLLKIKKAFALDTSIGDLKRFAENTPHPIARKITYIQAIRRCCDVGLEEECLEIRLEGKDSRVLPINVSMIGKQ